MELETISLNASSPLQNASSSSINIANSQPLNAHDLSQMDVASSNTEYVATEISSTTSPCSASSSATRALDSAATPMRDLRLEQEADPESIVLENSASSPTLRQLLDYSDISSPLSGSHDATKTFTDASFSPVSTSTRPDQFSDFHSPPTSPALAFSSNSRSTTYSRSIISRPSVAQDPSIQLRSASLSFSPEINSAVIKLQPPPLAASPSFSESTSFDTSSASLPPPEQSQPEKSASQADIEAVPDHRAQLDEQRTKRIRAMEDQEREAKKIKLDLQIDKNKQEEKRQNKRAREAEDAIGGFAEGWQESQATSIYRTLQLEMSSGRIKETVVTYELEEGEIREETPLEHSIAMFPIADYDTPPHLFTPGEKAHRKSQVPETPEPEPEPELAPSKKKKRKKKHTGDATKKKSDDYFVPDDGYGRKVQLDSEKIQSGDLANVGSSSIPAPCLDLSESPSAQLIDYLKGLDSSLAPLAPLLQASGITTVNSLVEVASFDDSTRKHMYQEIVARGAGIDPSLFVLLESKLVEVIERARLEQTRSN